MVESNVVFDNHKIVMVPVQVEDLGTFMHVHHVHIQHLQRMC